MKTYFTELFDVHPDALQRYGAFNISLVTDLPLFIDPFLLFNSKKAKYQALHRDIIKYLSFLRDKSDSGYLAAGLIRAWFRFPEVKQTWLGFTADGNRGSGLGKHFASALHENLHKLFGNFGREVITRGSHLEKLCLIKDRVGKDNISDFTTNLIKEYLCEYTEAFTRKNIKPSHQKQVTVSKVRFNYRTESWESRKFHLPWMEDDYVLLTPVDILTKDDTWINKTDLVEDFESLPDSIPNDQLRAQVSNYFRKVLPKHKDKEPSKEERKTAAVDTILKFPQLIDVYIRHKEDTGETATSLSSQKVEVSKQLYVQQFKELRNLLSLHSKFYQIPGRTYSEARQRVEFMKDVVENKGGHKIFYVKQRPVEREEDLHIMYKLTWYGAACDLTSEANDGRGPVDFKVSHGAKDKTLVEFKLAKNTQLKRNLEKQTTVYEKASDAKKSIKVIVYFSQQERDRAIRILKELNLMNSPDVVLINARGDDKPSGSKA